MIALYGAGRTGQIARVAQELQGILGKKGVTVTTRKDFLRETKLVDQKIKEAKALGADDVVADLTAFKKELVELANNPEKVAGIDLMSEAEELSPQLAEFVAKFSSNRNSRVGPEHFKRIAIIMSEKLAERAPVTDTYIDFWKRVAQDYVRDTGKNRIPWVTFDGKTLWQDYRPKVQQEIRFYDPNSRRYIRNIYQAAAEDGKLLGKAEIGDARRGFGVNGTHADDASIVRAIHLWGRREGIDTATVHDAAALNINELDPMIQEVRRIYADFSTKNKVKMVLDKLKEEGLSDELYKKYMKEAEDFGYFNKEFTPEEVLKEIKAPYHWYAWGP